MDFATSILPGWHSTIFPPYFVVGALYSGFAMVLTLVVPTRRLYRLENVITTRHLDKLAKMTLLTGYLVIYSYVAEIFMAWYSGDPYERYTYLIARPTGPFAVAFWIVIACNCGTPQLLWLRSVRTSPIALFIASLFIQLGMWMERFMLIVSSLNRDYLPSSWHGYRPSFVDLTILFGSISFFLFLFLLFLRFVPFVPISEVKELRRELCHEDERNASRGGADVERAHG